MAIALLGLGVAKSFAASPTLQWLGVSGVLFDVDEQTNAYINASGPIVILNAAGAAVQTNTICPVYGRTQRDAAGNYYFANTFNPPVDFGGVTLTNSSIFVAKYNTAGTLQWARTLGPAFANAISVTDFRVEPGGTAYVGYYYCLGSSCSLSYNVIDRVDSSGASTRIMNYTGSESAAHAVRLGVATSSNVCALIFNYWNFYWAMSFQRIGDGSAEFSNSGQSDLPSKSYRGARPIRNSLGEFYTVEANLLTKRNPAGAVLWTTDLGNQISWTIGEDEYEGVHVADGNGLIRRYDYDGNLAWTINAGNPVDEMIVDAQGNRFFSTFQKYVGRLGPETIAAPAITDQPQGTTVFSGSNVVLSLTATGSGPLRYFWHRDGVFVANQTNASLNLPNAAAAQSGSYTVIVSNFVNSVTSSPAVVRIKAVQLFKGSQMLTNGIYSFITPATISVLSAFASGSIFYTLDGSPPTFNSAPYNGPITVSNNVTLRALGYSADFTQSEEADLASFVFPPKFSLSTSVVGPGGVTLNPAGGLYATGTVVTATATASNGWSFLSWAGDAAGTGNAVNLVVDRNLSIQAVFGTTLSTTATGGGQVQRFPPGGVYPYGTVVRLTAIPDAGKYFGVWGNAASGNVNPLYFTVTNPSPTVSSLFAPLSVAQTALTVLIEGPGSVVVNPPGNMFPTSQVVSITATPFAGKGFAGWSGDASGTQNPLALPMLNGQVVTANFLNWPFLTAGAQNISTQGFKFKLTSGAGMTYEVLASSNLNHWASLGFVTNVTGETEFTDGSATNAARKFYKAVP